MSFALVLLYVVAINAFAIAAFALDKAKAIDGRRRIRESDLLMLATIGGSPGAFWARQRFRHKTRKQPFSSRLETIAMLQAGLALGLAVTWATV